MMEESNERSQDVMASSSSNESLEAGIQQTTTTQDDTADQQQDDEDDCRKSLNSYYGNRLGILQSLSLLLNAGLMVYAHVGLSAVILSSRPPLDQQQLRSLQENNTTACNEQDFVIWQSGGQANRTIHSNYCSREYNGGCLLDENCIAECFTTVHGYSPSCSACFGALPDCSLANGCALVCASDSFGIPCQECNIPCTEELDLCLGFPEQNGTNIPTFAPGPTVVPVPGTGENSCTEVDLDSIDRWYVVYEMTFVDAIEKAWNGGVKLLAFIVVIFSGIWPYGKNIILMFVWYMKLSPKRRSSILVWLTRLSKYTLVDVFAVITVLVGVLLELDVGGTQVVVRGEPRPAIICFFVATLWEFVQIEWTFHKHKQHVVFSEFTDKDDKDDSPTSLLGALRFRTQLRSNHDCVAPKSTTAMQVWVGFLLISTIALYISGSVTDMIRFISYGSSSTGCVKSYNLVSFGNAMVSELALTDNSAKPGTWTLYIIYVLLVLALPILVHVLQIVMLVFQVNNKRLAEWTGSTWGFSSVEVLLIGVFSVEHAFEKFVAQLAGNDSSQFFTITSSLQDGYFILIGYSIAAGLLQYFVQCAVSEFYKIDPYHKVHVVWFKALRCWLKE